MTRILYLTHDLADPTTTKRVRMLLAGGATVHVAGFRRTDAEITAIENCPVTNLGRTHNGRFAQRILSTIREVLSAKKHHALFESADIILARNLEMLAIGVRGRSLCAKPPAIIYESLDIHRLLLRNDAISTALRTLEGWLARRASALITSSPAFISDYFEARSRVKLPTILLENKVFATDEMLAIQSTTRANGAPWRIGWFGAIRCRKSLDLLCATARAHPNLVEIIIRGRPSYDQFENFDAQVSGTPNLRFLGPYDNPADLPNIYGEIHFNWAIDFFEEGLNSTWLLPNRLYEGGLFGAVPLAVANVETSRFIANLNIGHTLANFTPDALAEFLQSLTTDKYRAMQQAVTAIPPAFWTFSRAEFVALVNQLTAFSNNQRSTFSNNLSTNKGEGWVRVSATPTLIIIPSLNEAAHIESLVQYLLAESTATPMIIVIADGGSSDGTAQIANHLADTHSNVHYLHNPKRNQSAAINLAVEQFGDRAQFLIRIDAHAHYPHNFCRALLEEAAETGADSVAVSMHTVGTGTFQKAIAAAQNSKLGNGGAIHRGALTTGSWVEHGHHALMRIAAFRAIGGYDETFTHNEDAELDTRLTRAGFRIWLTAATSLIYFPRATAAALFKQYRNYGDGRAHTILKHRQFPKLRQLLPVGIAPAALLLVATPITSLAALPLAAWAALCLGYGAIIAARKKQPHLILSGPATMLMHSGWSIGFWQAMLFPKKAPQ